MINPSISKSFPAGINLVLHIIIVEININKIMRKGIRDLGCAPVLYSAYKNAGDDHGRSRFALPNLQFTEQYDTN
jgi:hypothetical protein